MFIDELTLHLKAGRGGDGVVRWRHEKGKDHAGPSGGNGGMGRDVLIKLPVGSRLTNLVTGYSIELLTDTEKVLLLRGGRGGLGNEHFKGSINIRPKQSTPGVEGEEADFHIELFLVVDVGIIGLPNAGKSSLLNALTNAQSRVGNFPFTTLEPALGDFYGLVMADIPGLIEGATKGKGFGHKFLRHIERTKAI